MMLLYTETDRLSPSSLSKYKTNLYFKEVIIINNKEACSGFIGLIAARENFIELIKKFQNVLKIWRIRNLTVQGKITIFKTLAISKVIHLTLVTNVPQVIINQLNKIHKDFIWN